MTPEIIAIVTVGVALAGVSVALAGVILTSIRGCGRTWHGWSRGWMEKLMR